MTGVKEIHIRCLHCGSWFRSPISIKNLETFDSAMLIGNKVQCPNCKKMTGCNKENMRVRAQNAGFVGDDTIHT